MVSANHKKTPNVFFCKKTTQSHLLFTRFPSSAAAAATVSFWPLAHFSAMATPRSIAPIEQAVEGQLEVGGGITLWFREWGNPAGTPVVFVHGGPGQCVADYNNINARFFDDSVYRVVEVLQRNRTRVTTPLLSRL